MPTATLAPSVQIGEILVPGATSLHGAKTFMLTRSAQGGQGFEVVFGLFAGDTQKRVIERLTDRLVEDMRSVVFEPGAGAEERFEAGLKRANSIVLSFLHEHGLSLPGIKLRGAFGMLSGNRMYIASRGSVRGTVVVPQTHVKPLAAFTLFEEGSDTAAHPKFFSSFQDGTLPPGARLFIASAELFQATDEAFAIGRFTDPDSTRAIRDLKNALKSSRLPVSVLTLAIPKIDAEESVAIFKGQVARAKVQVEAEHVAVPRPRVAATKADVADVGDLVSRGLRASATGVAGGLRVVPKTAAAIGKTAVAGVVGAGHLVARVGSGFVNLFRNEDGRFGAKAIVALPSRALDAGIGGINRVPRHRVAHFVAVFVLVNVIAHGTIFAVRRQLIVGDVKAYESQLASATQLQTDLETSLIYGNDARAQELAAQLEAVLGSLPQDTDAQKRSVASAKLALDNARLRMRKALVIPSPTTFAALGNGNARAMAWWNGGLYAFSSLKPEFRAVGADGTVAPAVALKNFSAGISQAVPSTSGIILLGTDGALGFWNPAGDAVTPYDGVTLDAKKPILFYQSRIYTQDAQNAIVRRSVLSKALGSPVSSIPAETVAGQVSGIAADGALYLLTPEGAVRKFIRGTLDENFHRALVEPAPTQAAGLSIASNRIAYFDAATDRLIVIDTRDGSLIAQATAPAMKDIRAIAVNDKKLLVLAGDGTVYGIEIGTLKP